MDEKSPCPELVELKALLHDALPDERAEALLPHVGACEKCQAHMDQVSGTRSFRGNYLKEKLPDRSDHNPSKEFVSRLIQETAVPDKREVAIDQELSFLTVSKAADHLGMIGPYEVLEVVGRGGMGLVLRAVDPALEREIAIKVLAPTLAASKTARERFIREARAAAAIDHENVLPIHAVSHHENLPYFTMPLVAGQSLQELLDQRDSPFPVGQVMRISRKIASGLAAAHAKGLIHRDIKPANILLDRNDNRVWLADFGLARALQSPSGTVTEAGTLVGTPQFMAPEQLDDKSPNERSDLFSLGAVLYYLATGTPPFAAKSTASTIRKVIDGRPPEPLKINSELPGWFSELIENLLRKVPAERPSSAQSVLAIMEEHGRPTAAPAPSAAHRWLAAGGLMLAMGLLALWLTQREPEPFRLSSTGKTYPTFVEAVEHAIDGDTIEFTHPYTQISGAIDLGSKDLTLTPQNSYERTVVDFTPLPEPESTERVYEMPLLRSGGALKLEGLTFVRKHVRQGHRQDAGHAPLLRSDGNRLIIKDCRFELQQPNFVGIPLGDIVISDADECEIIECTFLHVNRGISLLFRNAHKEPEMGASKIRLHGNVAIGSTAFVSFDHRVPREMELSMTNNVVATKHPYVFRSTHVWADVRANSVEGNTFSYQSTQRMCLIRTHGSLNELRSHLNWVGRRNTIASIAIRPDANLDTLAMARVTGDLPPGTRRPVVHYRNWNSLTDRISETDLNRLHLETPFMLPKDLSLDQIDVSQWIDQITEDSALDQP